MIRYKKYFHIENHVKRIQQKLDILRSLILTAFRIRHTAKFGETDAQTLRMVKEGRLGQPSKGSQNREVLRNWPVVFFSLTFGWKKVEKKVANLEFLDWTFCCVLLILFVLALG